MLIENIINYLKVMSLLSGIIFVLFAITFVSMTQGLKQFKRNHKRIRIESINVLNYKYKNVA